MAEVKVTAIQDLQGIVLQSSNSSKHMRFKKKVSIPYEKFSLTYIVKLSSLL